MALKSRELTAQARSKSLVFIAAYICFMIATAVVFTKYVDQERLQSIVKSTGNLGIVLFFLIELVYVTFTPLFNTFILIAAGYLFGGPTGFWLNFLATSCGLFLIIFLVKKYGTPLLEKLVSPSAYAKFDKVAQKAGPMTLLVCYVLPFTPDDELTYIVAAGHLPFKRFILPVVLGTIAKSAYSYIGALGAEGITIAVYFRIVILVVGVILVGLQEYTVKWWNKS